MSAPTAAFAHPPVYSPWFTFSTQAPWEPGVYAVLTGGGEYRFSYWDGDCWHCTAPSVAGAHEMSSHPTGCVIVDWRGIAQPPRLPRFVSETLPQARARVASGELIALRPRADGNYTLPEAPVPAVPPTTPKPRTPSNGCHNRAPFKVSTELRDHHGRLVTSWPFRMASDCQYTLSELGQADKACHGCCWRREPMAECTETQPSS